MIHSLAQELNEVLKSTPADSLFSDLGKRMYFPKGIIAQSGEAKKFGKTANATIGMTVIDGKPVILPSIEKNVPGFSARELVAYAPTAGNPDLRTAWKEKITIKNPSLQGTSISLPVVVPGLTAGISYIADLFLGPEEPLLAADPSWDNYSLVAETRRGADFHRFTMFRDGKFNIEGLEEAIRKEAESGSVRVLLNFPQNPSGYSPTKEEAQKICRIIKDVAESGTKMLVICDDAYFGLNYEKNIEPQSLFAYLADIHPNVLAVKIDGPTKEDFVWGFRCGFLTFGSAGMKQEQYEALVKKLMGVIRSSVSCSSTPVQSIMLRAFQDPDLEKQKLQFREVLQSRYRKVKDFVSTHSSECVIPLPFNSGYFMSIHLDGIDAEQLRQELLHKQGIGTIAIDSCTLRIAFSSLDEDRIDAVYSAIYETAEKFSRH